LTKAAIVILSPSALPMANRISEAVDAEIHAPFGAGADIEFDHATSHVAALFKQATPIIGICAAGILIRALSHLTIDKFNEPPVLAVSHDGSSVVPLLGGHHRANELATFIANQIGGHAALTTASDVTLGIDLESPPQGHVLGTPELIKSTVRKLLNGLRFEQQTDAPWLAPLSTEGGTIPVRVTIENPQAATLTYHPRLIAVGVGCERGCEPQEVADLIRATLATHNISAASVACFATIDLKEDEPAITQLGKTRYFTTAELNAMSAGVKRPSAIVLAEVGTPSVAEAAALAAAGAGAQLIAPKQKSKRATCAVALAPSPILEMRGRGRGCLHVIGLGPGAPAMRSPEASYSLSHATDWVGYGLYLDLASDLRTSQLLHPFPLGAEETRVRHAIKLAREGRNVALICSGDAGIYAMASLVCEILDFEPARFELNVVPGISAFQAAAARVGALIGHDFCCISLSDLLTPWDVIEKRIASAAEGDFVVAFYNPRSIKRETQLAQAMDILRPARKSDTPVILATNLGRIDENVRIVKMSEFDPSEVDMLTVVLVGSSQSASFRRGDGKIFAYTPRGYSNKRAAE
jgi:cobalt-precorrin 5A hydrolase / precorrin-3B C17-methyltransferase